MKTSINDRKLNIIENVPLIKDDELIKKIEKLIAKSISNEFHEPTKEYLITKAQQANKDIKDGNVKSVSDLERDIKKW